MPKKKCLDQSNCFISYDVVRADLTKFSCAHAASHMSAETEPQNLFSKNRMDSDPCMQ